MGAQPPVAANDAAFPSPYLSRLIQNLARTLSRRPGFCRSEEEDIAQELRLALHQKRHSYDPSRGASPDTFGDRVVRSTAKMILRDRMRAKRAAGFFAMSLGAELPGESATELGDIISAADDHRRGPESQHRDDTDLAMTIEAALAPLPQWIVEVARRLRSDTRNKVAQDLGISRRQLRKVIEQIRRRFEEVGLVEDEFPS